MCISLSPKLKHIHSYIEHNYNLVVSEYKFETMSESPFELIREFKSMPLSEMKLVVVVASESKFKVVPT